MAQPYSTVNAPDSALQYLLPTHYDDLLLTEAQEKFVLYNLVDAKPLPKNSGNVIKWSRYTLLGPVNQATIGTAPTPTALSAVNVTGTLIQFLGSTTTADVLEMTAIDPQIESAVRELSYQAANTIDTYIRNVMIGLTGGVSSTNQNVGAPFGNSNGSLIHDIPTSLNTLTLSALTKSTHKTTIAAVQDEVSYLRNLNAPTFGDGFYYGVLHPNIETAIMQDSTAVTSWAAWNAGVQYGIEKMERGYVGVIAGVKFWRSTNMWLHNSGTGASTSAYYSPIFGPGAVGVVDIDGGVKTYVVQGADHSNPGAQWSTITWKITTAAAVLNPSFGIIMISTT